MSTDVKYKHIFLSRNTLHNESEFPKIVENIIPTEQKIKKTLPIYRGSIAIPLKKDLNISSSRELLSSKGSSHDQPIYNDAKLVLQKSEGGVSNLVRRTSFFQEIKEVQQENKIKRKNRNRESDDSFSEDSSSEDSSEDSSSTNQQQKQIQPMSGTGGQKKHNVMLIKK